MPCIFRGVDLDHVETAWKTGMAISQPTNVQGMSVEVMARSARAKHQIRPMKLCNTHDAERQQMVISATDSCTWKAFPDEMTARNCKANSECAGKAPHSLTISDTHKLSAQ